MKSFALLLMIACPLTGKEAIYQDAKKAAADPLFQYVGEYELESADGEKFVAQVTSVNGELTAAVAEGGRADVFKKGVEWAVIRSTSVNPPTWTWDGYEVILENGKVTAGGEKMTTTKLARQSETLGAKAPEGAVVLFDGKKESLANWKGGKLDEGFLREGCQTQKEFGSFHLHLEFCQPYKPGKPLGNQDRGNSGIYIYNRYEVQVLDSFGVQFFHQNDDEWRKAFEDQLGFKPQSDRKQWCGCFYKAHAVDVNACLPPLAWQTYDIDFTAPVFEGEKKVKNARATVKLNGITIHDDVELKKGTGVGGSRPEVARGAIFIQAHGNPVRYRNIWLVEKK